MFITHKFPAPRSVVVNPCFTSFLADGELGPVGLKRYFSLEVHRGIFITPLQ
jgi:hypothetical protein